MTEAKPLPRLAIEWRLWRPHLITAQPRGCVSIETKTMTAEHLALLLKGMPAEERVELLMLACDANGESRELFLSEVSRRLLDLSEKVLLLQTERADRAEAKLREMEGK
jgi:hypothetical protein